MSTIDKKFLNTLPDKPGVYQMLDKNDKVIYVGKARNLKKRVKSYFQKNDASAKTQSLVSHIAAINITVTSSETEALILESNLIKQIKPRYNILLRDDKAYPYIFVSTEHPFPRIDLHRGAKRTKGRYFGPYPSSYAVRETLNLLQKLFKVRQCRDSFYASRSRPCLQYQIKRCTAPCVDYINQADYQEDLKHAVLFLEGKNQQIITELVDKMQMASDNKKYEDAAIYRDLVGHLRKIQEQQYVTTEGKNTDVVAAYLAQGHACITVMTIRGGRLLGSKNYFPKMPAQSELADVLEAFIPQYYLNEVRTQHLPNLLIVNASLPNSDLLSQFLAEKRQGKVVVAHRVRGERARWLEMANKTAQAALTAHLSTRSNVFQQFEDLKKLLNLDSVPRRIECFDISHSQGEETVASCVVFDQNGPSKQDYRRFNIKNITPGDDYAAITQALTRRYQRLKEGEGQLPDVLIVDGGKGQLTQAANVVEELQLIGITLVGITKGPGRLAQYDKLMLLNHSQPIALAAHSSAGHLIQQLRDEAHRFAITAHRQRRDKKRQRSVLEDIDGVGAKRRQELLRQFGGIAQLRQASIEEIAKVPGISLSLAQRIFDVLHN